MPKVIIRTGATAKIRAAFNSLKVNDIFSAHDFHDLMEKQVNLNTVYTYFAKMLKKKCCSGDCTSGARLFIKLKDDDGKSLRKKQYKLRKYTKVIPKPLVVTIPDTSCVNRNPVSFTVGGKTYPTIDSYIQSKKFQDNANIGTVDYSNGPYSLVYKPITSGRTIIAEQIIELVNLLKEENARLFADNKELTIRNEELLAYNASLLKTNDENVESIHKYQTELAELKKNHFDGTIQL